MLPTFEPTFPNLDIVANNRSFSTATSSAGGPLGAETQLFTTQEVLLSGLLLTSWCQHRLYQGPCFSPDVAPRGEGKGRKGTQLGNLPTGAGSPQDEVAPTCHLRPPAIYTVERLNDFRDRRPTVQSARRGMFHVFQTFSWGTTISKMLLPGRSPPGLSLHLFRTMRLHTLPTDCTATSDFNLGGIALS